MKTFAIVSIEIGMLLGIVVAAFTVPRSTPLLTFLIISGAFFVAGNGSSSTLQFGSRWRHQEYWSRDRIL